MENRIFDINQLKRDDKFFRVVKEFYIEEIFYSRYINNRLWFYQFVNSRRFTFSLSFNKFNRECWKKEINAVITVINNLKYMTNYFEDKFKKLNGVNNEKTNK